IIQHTTPTRSYLVHNSLHHMPPLSFTYTSLFRSAGAATHRASGRSPLAQRQRLVTPAPRQRRRPRRRRRPPPQPAAAPARLRRRSEEHTSELQSREKLVCRLLLEKKKTKGRLIFN